VISANFKQLLEVVKSLVADDAPFVMNGGVALYLYLNEINYYEPYRITSDIDFSVTNPYLSLDTLLESMSYCQNRFRQSPAPTGAFCFLPLTEFDKRPTIIVSWCFIA
jgi:hypothetical protein